MLPLLSLFATTAVTAHAGDVDFDVVVYGSTPGGIAAATAAGRLGMSVGLYEPLPMIGGMGAAGALGLHDGAGIGEGLALEWQMLNAKAYNVKTPILQPESFVGEASFRTMLANASVTTIKVNCPVTAATTAKGADGVSRVATISMACEPKPVSATVFIDASYDGDVMVAAGDIDYTAGREANTTYNESYAGARVPGWVGVSGPRNISAVRDDGTLLKYVQNLTDLAPPGTADDALMAFQHRLCISEGDDMVPWPKPDGYSPDDFELLQRVIDATGSADSFTRMPPGPYHGYPGPKKKYDLCCGITVVASDQPNLNRGWANASWEERNKIVEEHTYFEMGSFYYLANDPKVPESIRSNYQKYGLCKDEFQEYGNIPPQLYVRISNRLVGDFVMTQNNICEPKENQSIALGDWSFDEHMTGKYAVPDGNGGYTVMLEGNFWPSIQDGCNNPHSASKGALKNAYNVPYAAIVPKRGQGGNLLVPVCLSASAVAYASTRIESMFMFVGTAAGVAAAQVVANKAATVQDVDVSTVQGILVETFKQQIHLPGPPPANPPLYYNVSGAGDAEWNGQYKIEKSSDGTLQYRSTTCSKCELYAYDGIWRLAVMGHELYYETLSYSALPPKTGWTVSDGGVAPAPTLVDGPTEN